MWKTITQLITDIKLTLTVLILQLFNVKKSAEEIAHLFLKLLNEKILFLLPVLVSSYLSPVAGVLFLDLRPELRVLIEDTHDLASSASASEFVRWILRFPPYILPNNMADHSEWSTICSRVCWCDRVVRKAIDVLDPIRRVKKGLSRTVVTNHFQSRAPLAYLMPFSQRIWHQ